MDISKIKITSMIDRFGKSYPGGIDINSDVEHKIDWLCKNKIPGIERWLSEWFRIAVADVLTEYPGMDLHDVISEVMYSENYSVSDQTSDLIVDVYEYFQSNNDKIVEWEGLDNYEVSERISNFLSQRFLPIRKEGNNIYIQITSEGYSWNRVIDDYLYMIYQDDTSPISLWIGHGVDTDSTINTLFSGTTSTLYRIYDKPEYQNYRNERDKMYNSFDEQTQMKDRVVFGLDKLYMMFAHESENSFKHYR